MQCNHSFCGTPFSSFGQQFQQCGQQCVHCNTAYSCKRSPEVIGEGDVTTLVLPDGSTQMYFIPASPSSKCCPVPFNLAFGNLQYPVLNQPIYFIRSISPAPFTLLQQTQPTPQYGFSYPTQPINPFECRPNIPLPPPTPLQFHNDDCTSTSDLRYFFPQSTRHKTLHSAAIQASAPMNTGTCPDRCGTIDHNASSQAPSAMETGTGSDTVILEQVKSTCAEIQTSDVIFCNCASSSKNEKSKEVKKSRSCASIARKSRHKIKKKKSRAKCECNVLSDPSSHNINSASETSIKSCTTCSSCQSGYKKKKSPKKSKKRERSVSKTSVTSSTQSCKYCRCKSDVSYSTSQTSALSENEPKQKKPKKENKIKEKKTKKEKKNKERKTKKDMVSKSTSPKSDSRHHKPDDRVSFSKSSNIDISGCTCCSNSSMQSTTDIKEETQPKQRKEKRVKDGNTKKETKDRKSKLKKEIKVNSGHSKDLTSKKPDDCVLLSRKSSTNTDVSSRTHCSDSSLQPTSNIKEENGSKKTVEDANTKKEIKERKSKLKKEMKEKESILKMDFKDKISELRKEMKEKKSELENGIKITRSESKSKKEKQSKVKKHKNEAFEVHREETEMTGNSQQSKEDSDKLCDCSRICSSIARTPEKYSSCCSKEAILKKDFCCMTSLKSKDKYFDMDCLFQDTNSDVTSYLIANTDLDSTVPSQMLVWYPGNTIILDKNQIVDPQIAKYNSIIATNNIVTDDTLFTTDN